MSKTAKSTELVETPDDVAAFLVPATSLPDYINRESGRGNENVTSTDIVLPRLEICQATSPIKDVVEDIREGELFNTASSESIGDIAYIIPVFFKLEWIVWTQFDEGGGFHGSFGTKEAAIDRVKELVAEGEDENILEIVDTPTHYCLRMFMDPFSQTPVTEQIVVSMPRSKAKVSRKWNSLIQMAGGDRFSRAYKFTTFKDKNKKNQSFYNYTVMPAGFTPKPIFEEAERVYDIFMKQGVRTDYTVPEQAAGADSEI